MGEIKTVPYVLCDEGVRITIDKSIEIIIPPNHERIIFAPNFKKDNVHARKKSDFEKSNRKDSSKA